METDIAANISKVRDRITAAAARGNRPKDAVKLLAVTKTVPPSVIQQAINSGLTAFGENYVQEARDKIAAIEERVSWHMIGHLQTNKAKYAVNLFDTIHSVDRLELALEINKRSAAAGRRMNILIEVNVSGEESKSGLPADGVANLIREISSLKNLSVKGLMTMAPYSDNPENSRPFFAALRRLRDDVSEEKIAGVQLDELSMGMTDDFEIAIEEGATIVRVGRAIFGERNY